MMESNFYSDDFERLIREKTDQYKMYPSEKVWKGVYSSLHTKKRWFIGGMSILVTGIIVVAGRELILPSAHPGSQKKQPLTASLTTPKTTTENTVLPAPFTEYRDGAHSTAYTHNGHSLGPLADVSLTTEEIGGVEMPNVAMLDGRQADPAAVIGQTLNISATSTAVDSRPSVRMTLSGAGISRAGNHGSGFGSTETRPLESYASYLSRMRTGNGLTFGDDPYEAPVVFATSTSFPGSLHALGIHIPLHSSVSNRLMSPFNATELIEPVVAGDDEDQMMDPDTSSYTNEQKINWLQDYAVYNLHATPRKSKLFWQMYIAPDENVRMISGVPVSNEKFNSSGAPTQLSSAKPNGFSKFLQNMGFATGVAVLYKLSPTVSIKGGLQFNYSRFAVNTPTAGIVAGSSPQPPVLTAGGLQDSVGGTMGAPSPGGQTAQVLYNEYFQLSAPVGVELRVWGNERLQVNIAATVQPAYMLNTNAYLLTTEGNNYVQMPSMFRKWNIDGGAEAYISYKMGGFRIQAGPDFRYQFLSSYVNRYPTRENLASYGLKIGIIKAIR